MSPAGDRETQCGLVHLPKIAGRGVPFNKKHQKSPFASTAQIARPSGRGPMNPHTPGGASVEAEGRSDHNHSVARCVARGPVSAHPPGLGLDDPSRPCPTSLELMARDR